jgi:general stress protein 26
MGQDASQADREKVWSLIKGFHTALFVTLDSTGAFETRPMGCLQKSFGGTLWFMTFQGSAKLKDICGDSQVLVAYMQPDKYEYVAIYGRAQIVENKQKLRELWSEGLRVWFPKGPEDPDIALIAVTAERADYWTNPASSVTYAWAYLKARVTGKSPSPDQIAEIKSVHFN